MFHLLAYTKATGGASTDQDMVAASDPVFSQRNSHYIFSEKYKALAVAAFGPGLTRVNIGSPSINAISKFNVWPLNDSSVNLSPTRVDQWLAMPWDIPDNEEIQVFNTDANSEQATVFLWVATPDHSFNIPRGIGPLPIFECRVTATITPTLNTWSGLSAVTFEQSLRGGTYAVVGAQFQATNLLAVRLVFPRQKLNANRAMRPGVLATDAIGDQMMAGLPYGPMSWGEYGRFSTFEPFQIELWKTATTSTAVEGRIWLVRLSESMDVQY